MANLTPEACRAARALLKMSVRDLGSAAELSFETVSLYENGRPMRETSKAKILAVFEARGIEILNGDSPGARLKPVAP